MGEKGGKENERERRGEGGERGRERGGGREGEGELFPVNQLMK